MKKLNIYINEALVKTHVGKKSYNYFPETKEELKELIKQLIEERGEEADLNDIDVSKVTDMNYIFYKSKFNGDISEWDVSNVTNMRSMFYNSPLQGKEPQWYKDFIKKYSGGEKK